MSKREPKRTNRVQEAEADVTDLGTRHDGAWCISNKLKWLILEEGLCTDGCTEGPAAHVVGFPTLGGSR